MATIGNKAQAGNYSKLDDISTLFDGTITTFSLKVQGQPVIPESAIHLEINLDGVTQEPGIAYTTSVDTITFTTAPIASVVFWGKLAAKLDVGTVSDNTISTAKLQPGAVTADKLADTLNALRYISGWNATTNTVFPSGANAGDYYKVTGAGTLDTIVVQVGDSIIANRDLATTGNTDWDVMQGNLDIETTVTATDLKVPTSQAVQTYASSQLLAERQSWPYAIAHSSLTTYFTGATFPIVLDAARGITISTGYLSLPIGYVYLIKGYSRIIGGDASTYVDIQLYRGTAPTGGIGSTSDMLTMAWSQHSSLENYHAIVDATTESILVTPSVSAQSGTAANTIDVYVSVQVIG